MFITMPDCVAPDSTAQACLGVRAALPEVSSINKPGERDGKVDLESGEAQMIKMYYKLK